MVLDIYGLVLRTQLVYFVVWNIASPILWIFRLGSERGIFIIVILQLSQISTQYVRHGKS
jgi:hypothetical protein